MRVKRKTQIIFLISSRFLPKRESSDISLDVRKFILVTFFNANARYYGKNFWKIMKVIPLAEKTLKTTFFFCTTFYMCLILIKERQRKTFVIRNHLENEWHKSRLRERRKSFSNTQNSIVSESSFHTTKQHLRIRKK